MRRSVRRPWSTTALVASLLLAACGTTAGEYPEGALEPIVDAAAPAEAGTATGAVTQDPSVTGSSDAADAGELPIAASRTGVGDGGVAGGSSGVTSSSGSTTSGATGEDTSAETTTGSGDTTDGGGTTDGSGATGGSAAVAMGPGVTTDTITIGFQNAEDVQAGFAVVGASGDPADERKLAEALVRWVNDTGGIRGRQLAAVHHGTDATSGTWASQAQAACSTFTEDNQVLAVVSSAVGGDDSLLACLAEKQTPDVELNLWLFDQPYFEQHRGLLYRPGKMRADVWAREYIEGLAQIGYFDGATVGLMRFDAPVFERLSAQVVNPTAERLGVTITDEVAISTPKSVSDFGGMASEFNNAIVRFRSQGIDHVLMLENAGIMPFFFHQQAESQNYRPTYGLTSTDIPNTLANQSPIEQLRGSVGIGWTPPNDTPHDHQPGGNPNYTLCREILSEYGVTNLTGFYAQARCDAVFFLRAALGRAPDLTRAGLLAGVEALGGDYLSPFTAGSSYGPDKYDGADMLRPFAFDDGCECFRYTHEPYRRD